MHFRSYTPSDIEAMCHLDAICFAEPFRFDRQMMQQFAEEPRAVVVLVEDGDASESRIIAFSIFHLEGTLSESFAYVVTIDVSPEHRRHGVGNAMLKRAEAAARSAGATQITLHVAAGNLGAIAFYVRLRYRHSGVARRFYWEAGQDATCFTKTL